jgi:hypothetical protein
VFDGYYGDLVPVIVDAVNHAVTTASAVKPLEA